MECPVITWSVLSSHGVPCDHMVCPVVTWSALWSHGVSCRHMEFPVITLCPVITWSVLSSHGVSCHNMECRVITWSVLSSHGMSCDHVDCPVITWSVLWPHPGHGSLRCQYTQRQSACSVGWTIQASISAGADISIFIKTSRSADCCWWHAKCHLNLCTCSRGSSHATVHEQYNWLPIAHYAPQIAVVQPDMDTTDVSKEPAASIFATVRAPDIIFVCRVSEVKQFRPSAFRKSRVSS
jgi:hypothetical protein